MSPSTSESTAGDYAYDTDADRGFANQTILYDWTVGTGALSYEDTNRYSARR